MKAGVVFLHVPKCAGTSVISMLAKVYRSRLHHDRTFRDYRGPNHDWQWQSRLPLSESPQSLPQVGLEVIAGHFTWVKYRWLGWPHIVFLRDPLSRIVSQYSVGYNRETRVWEYYVDSGANSVSRMVGSLGMYAFVGLQERFEESIEMLEDYLGVEFNRTERKNRQWREKYKPTRSQVRYFKKTNGADYALYKEAVARFDEQREYYERKKSEAHQEEGKAVGASSC